MSRNRAGDTSRRSGNSPAIVLSRNFVPGDTPPEPYDIQGSIGAAKRNGFEDAETREAEFFFGRTSYQHASEYFSSFERLGSLYAVHRAILFDRKFQAILMEYIGLFELQFRAQYGMLMAGRHGAFAHRNPRNFRNQGYFDNFLADYGRELSYQINARNAQITSAYNRYGDVPMWMAVELMSFGTLSKLYSNTRDNRVIHGVADSFGVMSDTLTSWTRAVTVARNKCAHFSKLCGSPLVSTPRQIQGLNADNRNPFYLVLVLERLLSSSDTFDSDPSLCYALSLVKAVTNLIYRYRDIAYAFGFPENWNELLVDGRVIDQDVPPLPLLGPDTEGELDIRFAHGTGEEHSIV